MPCVFNLTDILELIVDSLDDSSLSEQYFVVEVHERVLHVPPDFGHQMYVVHEEHLKKVLADVPPVGKEFPEESLRKLSVLQRFPVIGAAWRELPLYNLSPLIDDQVQLEAVEPTHRALALRGPSPHGPVLLLTLDVA